CSKYSSNGSGALATCIRFVIFFSISSPLILPRFPSSTKYRYNDTALKEDGMWEPLVKIRPEIDFHGHNCCDYTGEADNTAYALHWISTHISSMPYLLSLHFINMWKPYTSEEGLPFIEFPTRISSRVVWNMIFIVSFPIFLLAAFGLFVTWKRW